MDTRSVVITPPHLGGHQGVTHTDLPTLEYIIHRYAPIRSMVDVGCGPGGMLDLARNRGISASGIDGDPAIGRDDIFQHDYTQAPLFLTTPSDLIWCVEFVEHVESSYIPHFLATFLSGRVLFLSHALPGQPGHHHVNCQPSIYWITVLQGVGFALDIEGSRWVQQNATDPYVRATGMIFTKGQP